MSYSRIVLANRIRCAAGSKDVVDRKKLEESCVSASLMLGGFAEYKYSGELEDLRWSVYQSCIAGAYAEMTWSDEDFGGVVAHWTVGITKKTSGWSVVLVSFEMAWDYVGIAERTYIGKILKEIGVSLKDGAYFESWNGPVFLFT